MGFCFKLGVMAGLATLGLCASEPSTPSDTPPRRITSVVRPDSRTGRLVRTVVVTPHPVVARTVEAPVVTPREIRPAAPEEPASKNSPLEGAVERIAAEHALSPELIRSVIEVESNYNPYAVSPKGALGLMQLIPATARRFGVADVFDPIDNIRGGARYLSYLLTLFNGNYPLALAAYNAGEGAVARYGGVPPYAETRQYVERVGRKLERARRAAPPREEKKQLPPEEAKAAGPNHIFEVVEPDGSVRYVSR
jgi:soluble lytic murein transglycosylase